MCRRTRRFDFFPLQSRSHPHYAGVSQFKALARGAPVRPSGRISGNINNKLVIISCMSLYSLFRHRAKTYRESSRRIESGCGKLRWLYAKRSDKPTRPGDITRINELALVCANCHRMIHAQHPWLAMDELRNLIRRRYAE